MRITKNIFKCIFPKTAICMVWTFLLLLINSHPALPQPNLRYYLEIDEQTWDAFYINISISNNRFEKLLCGFPEIDHGLALNYQAADDISKFEISDRFGDRIMVTQANSNSWLIDTRDKDIVNISYKVNNRKDQILGERLSRSFARIDCGSVFLYIRELKESPFSVMVRVPHGWKIATSLKSDQPGFEFDIDNYKHLLEHPLYMAPFEEIYFRIKDRTNYVIIDGRQTADVAKLSSIAAKVAFYQTRLFDDAPFEHYFFIFKLFSGQRPIVSKAYRNSSIYYLTYNSIKENAFDIAREISSNFFQVWNGNRFYPASMKSDKIIQNPPPCDLWFCYGVSDYYGSLSLARVGYWSEADFINYTIRTINRLLRYSDDEMPSLAMLSSHIMKYDYNKSIAFIRLKGHLVGLLLDLKIRELTGNRKSLDDVMFFMNKWFGKSDSGYYEGDVLRAIGAVTGVDLTSFFDLYINGTAKLPLIEMVQTAGIFLESKPDTIPDLGEFEISLDGNMVTQISKSSPLETAGMKTGDKLISLNDQPISYPQQIEQIVDTLVVDQEINVAIKREGLSLLLLARVAGKPCIALSLVSLEPQTEQQRMIRQSWLAKQLP